MDPGPGLSSSPSPQSTVTLLMHGWSACLSRETTWPEMIMIKAIMTMITMMIMKNNNKLGDHLARDKNDKGNDNDDDDNDVNKNNNK